MRKALVVLTVLVALSACDQAKKGFDEGFNKSFDEKFRSSCVSSASQKVSVPIANQLCDCALTKINQRYGIAEKASLKDEQFNPIIEQCVKSVVQENG